MDGKHETLEAYGTSKGMKDLKAHKYASGFFGGLEEIPGTMFPLGSKNNVTALTKDFRVEATNAIVTARSWLVTPVPLQSLQNLPKDAHVPSHVADIRRKKQ